MGGERGFQKREQTEGTEETEETELGATGARDVNQHVPGEPSTRRRSGLMLGCEPQTGQTPREAVEGAWGTPRRLPRTTNVAEATGVRRSSGVRSGRRCTCCRISTAMSSAAFRAIS